MNSPVDACLGAITRYMPMNPDTSTKNWGSEVNRVR